MSTDPGDPDMAGAVTIHVDGRAVAVAAGISVAAALLGAGVAAFRRSVDGEARGPVCGMGVCFECRVSVDGRAHVRSCLEPVRAGMEVRTGG
ncbi:MAG TPA: (2Fe-2S)-binding protein [Longimicrobiales bacterium]|nr:(2Fe-2S)-binding protein [Longimicrobiales bacterium]